MDRRRFALVGAGGVFTAEDAYAKIRNGASLVQLLTAMVYEGPLLARRIARGLAQLLERDGFKSVSEAVGAGLR
jgi:dihydroorotate dehydrogenase (fumarate)/dihydroorotate dehydrogenase